MRILITGGSGFVGRTLTSQLTSRGHQVIILTRSSSPGPQPHLNVTYVTGNPLQPGDWQQTVSQCDGVINLAGQSIFTRWTHEVKQGIYDSRILTTRNVVEALSGAATGSPRFLFSTSAVGYYGDREDLEVDEDTPPGTDFLAHVCQDWENEALQAVRCARVVLCRFGIVLGRNGGALGQMIPLFNRFIGGPLGSGKQWFSWIHEQDLAGIFIWLLDHPNISGPLNCTTPNPVQNRELARNLGQALHRPAFLPAPGFMVRLVMGELGSVLLSGQKVLPRKLINAGFEFSFPDLSSALGHILAS
ncbi:MAG: TIGR01777 family protein [Deltaproteobacteria bacterium]|nr:TIGR01777 family protein [Deltaproteobacteria bacterium]